LVIPLQGSRPKAPFKCAMALLQREIQMRMAKYGMGVAMLILAFTSATHAQQCLPGGLAVIVNKSNSVESLSMGQLRKLILGDVRAWQDHKAVALVARDASSKVFQCELSSIVRQSAADYQKYIANAELRGDKPIVIQVVDSDEAAARAVSGSQGAFAVVEANSVAANGSGVKVIHIDGKALGQAGYPL
jgi:ABC-type phosphate transport system substrate-binding protein